MKNVVLIGLLCLVVIMLLLCLYYINRWKVQWELEEPRPIYSVLHHNDDTLRVVMIGDSWAGLHSEMNMDTFLRSTLQKKLLRPVFVSSKGKGGEKSKGIYQLMFEKEGFGTQSLLTSGADYCIIFAGINDAAANLGIKQYCYYYRMILDFLLQNDIRPVIVEIPDVNIWNIYGDKPLKDLLADFLRSKMTGCHMYCYSEYRRALYGMLSEEHLICQVINVPMISWNGEKTEIHTELFLNDQIHLNRKGYELLDSCIADAIIQDLNNATDSTSAN